jgi:hypothetical protein
MARGSVTLSVRIVVETDADIGTPEYAKAFLALGARFPRWIPQRFGVTEPLRARLTPDSRREFVRLWEGREIRPGYSVGNIIVARRSPVAYRGMISWTRGQGALNRVGLSARVRRSQAALEEVLSFAKALFAALRGQFAFVASDDEYFAKNVTGWWTNPTTGKPQGGSARAPDRTRHLPGVYWATLFGPAYETLFSESKLHAAPALHRERLPDGGWLILTAPSPDDWNVEPARQLQHDVIEHLGRDAFFEPPFDRVRTIGGMLGGVSSRPLSADFFSSPDEAREFLARILDLVGRLRGRFRHGDRLDYSIGSLKRVDTYVLRRARDKTLSQDRDVALEVAAYLGEVVRRAAGGRWVIDPHDHLMPAVESSRLDGLEYPLVRVLKLWQDRERVAPWAAAMLQAHRVTTPTN